MTDRWTGGAIVGGVAADVVLVVDVVEAPVWRGTYELPPVIVSRWSWSGRARLLLPERLGDLVQAVFSDRRNAVTIRLAGAGWGRAVVTFNADESLTLTGYGPAPWYIDRKDSAP